MMLKTWSLEGLNTEARISNPITQPLFILRWINVLAKYSDQLHVLMLTVTKCDQWETPISYIIN